MIKAKKFNAYMRASCVDILASGEISPGRRLRKTQREALEAYILFLDRKDLSEEQKLSGFFEIPTGIGKTAFMGALIVGALRYAKKDKQKLRIGIIAPRNNLLVQNKDELESAFPELVDQIGLYGDKNKELNKLVTIITFDSWANLTDRRVIGKNTYDILFSDEGHRGTSIARQKRLVDFYTGILKIAVTATAHFDKEKTVYNTHRNNIFEKHINPAVRDDELASYIRVQLHSIRIPPSQIKNSSQAAEAKQIAFNYFALGELLDGVDARTGDRLTDNQGGIFVQNTKQADHLSNLINADTKLQKIAKERGCIDFAVSIHTVDMSPAEQERREFAYKAGRYLYVVGDEKFKEGFNHPPMKTIIDSPHGSLVDKVQIIGRGDRKWFNAAKNRYEGQTVIDTIIYIGNDDPEKDQKAYDQALKYAITGIEVLDGEIEVAGPSAPPQIVIKPSKTQPGLIDDIPIPSIMSPTKGFEDDGENVKTPSGKSPIAIPPPIIHTPYGKLKIVSHVELKDIRELLARKEQLNAEEAAVDWSNSNNRLEFEKLWRQKGRPGARTLFVRFKELPLEQQMNEFNELIANDDGVFDMIIQKHVASVKKSRIDVLMHILKNMKDVVDWRNSKDRKNFERLFKEKGQPNSGYLFDLFQKLPTKEQCYADGKPIFPNFLAISRITDFSIKSITAQQLNTLTSILEEIVNWQNKASRENFDKLWIRKGKPGGIALLQEVKKLSNDLKTPDNAEPLFKSDAPINQIIYNKSQQILDKQLRALMMALEAMEDKVEWKKGQNYITFGKLLARKGNPGRTIIFSRIRKLPKTKQLNNAGDLLFSNAQVLRRVLIGDTPYLLKSEHEALITALESMEDVATPSPAAKTLGRKTGTTAKLNTEAAILSGEESELKRVHLQKGRPSGRSLYRDYELLPQAKKIDGQRIPIFTSEDVIEAILTGKKKNPTTDQQALLISLLKNADGKIDWTDSDKRAEFDRLWIQKGKPGYRILYNLLEAESMTVRTNRYGSNIFGTEGTIAHILAGRKDSITESQLKTLVLLLRKLPDQTKNIQGEAKSAGSNLTRNKKTTKQSNRPHQHRAMGRGLLTKKS